MKPTTIHTICVGDEMPLIVQLAIENNKRIIHGEGINYLIHRVPRDKAYPCAGFQAEVLKLQLLGAISNIMVLDWDIWLIGIPDLPMGKFIYFGFGNGDGPDFFLTYNNDLMMKPIFTDFKVKEVKYRSGCPGFTKLFADRLHNAGLVKRYPDDAYCHFGTRLGLMSVTGEYKDLDDERKMRTEKNAFDNLINYYRSGGKK